MEIDKNKAMRLVKKQIKDQGCEGDDFSSLKLLQPHLFEWITFFGLNREDIAWKSKEKMNKWN